MRLWAPPSASQYFDVGHIANMRVTQLNLRTLIGSSNIAAHERLLTEIHSEQATSTLLVKNYSYTGSEFIVRAKQAGWPVCIRVRSLSEPRFRNWRGLRTCELWDRKSFTTLFNKYRAERERTEARGWIRVKELWTAWFSLPILLNSIDSAFLIMLRSDRNSS